MGNDNEQQETDSESDKDGANNRVDEIFRGLHMLWAGQSEKESTLRAKVGERVLDIGVDTIAYYTVIPEKEKQKLIPS